MTMKYLDYKFVSGLLLPIKEGKPLSCFELFEVQYAQLIFNQPLQWSGKSCCTKLLKLGAEHRIVNPKRYVA